MLKRLAGELEWNGGVDQLIAQIPAKAKIAALRGLLNRRGAQYGAVENAEKAVAERLRSRRDNGWLIIRRRHVEGITVPEDEVSAFSPSGRLAEEFKSVMRGADAAVDQRFDHAGAAAELAVVGRQISTQDDLLDSLAAEEKGLVEERARLDADWQALWPGTVVAPHEPDVMIEWLRARSEIVDLIARLATAELNTGAWQQREGEAKRLVLAELDRWRFQRLPSLPSRCILSLSQPQPRNGRMSRRQSAA